MRFVAEYLENTSRLLLRFLSVPSTPDIVQLGTYLVDGTPQIPEIVTVDIGSDDIKNGESHFYLTGYWPLPDLLDITLPDLTVQTVQVVQVVTHDNKWEPILADQPISAITPIAPEDKRPGEGRNPYIPETAIPSEYPPLWVEIALERTDPVRLGANMVSSPLTYVGGCSGRALSSSQAQVDTNIAPYLSYAPVRLEGQFTNSLYNSNFALSSSWPSPYFDPLPDGWTVVLADPMSMLRMQTSAPDAVLPAFTLRFHQHTGSDVSSIPPVVIYTPAITNPTETFQVIVAPSQGNASGRIQLKSADDTKASPIYPLMGGFPTLCSLNLNGFIGQVKIIWDQTKGDGEEQVIQLVAPSSSVYTGGHSYIPTGKTSYADVLTLDLIDFDKEWYFNKGVIRVDGSGDIPSQPFTWTIQIGSYTLLQVNGGVLSSDFMTTPSVLLSSYLPSVLNYKLIWTSLTSFKLVNVTGMTTVAIPFSLDLTSLAGSTIPLKVTLTGYKTNEGSSIAKRWAFSIT
jgi:hypothetical protein